MTHIYYHILRYDDGVAPCVDRGTLTLAICKPAIRRSAKAGDWVLGISTKSRGHKLCYVAKVTQKIDRHGYYVRRSYRPRGDCIYRLNGGRFQLRNYRVHGEADKKRDVGACLDTRTQ